MMKVEIRNLEITAPVWIIAIAAWLITTVSCTLFMTARLARYTEAIRSDHSLLMKMETQNRDAALDRDIAVRKELITVEERLKNIDETQLENIVKIEAIKGLVSERKREKEKR